MQNSDYWLSVYELLLVAEGAGQNVVVVKELDDAFHWHGATSLRHAGPIAYISRNSDRRGEVRSHFTRLLSMFEFASVRKVQETRCDGQRLRTTARRDIVRR